MAGLYIGGFASAHRLRRADLAPDPAAVAAVADAEAAMLAHVNADHADALDAIAAARGRPGAGWRMAACDVDGCDLARDEETLRVPWSASVANALEIRSELVRIARDARAG